MKAESLKAAQDALNALIGEELEAHDAGAYFRVQKLAKIAEGLSDVGLDRVPELAGRRRRPGGYDIMACGDEDVDEALGMGQMAAVGRPRLLGGGLPMTQQDFMRELVAMFQGWVQQQGKPRPEVQARDMLDVRAALVKQKLALPDGFTERLQALLAEIASKAAPAAPAEIADDPPPSIDAEFDALPPVQPVAVRRPT